MKALGHQFRIVGFVPTALAVFFILILINSGAPDVPFGPETLVETAQRYGAFGGVVLIVLSTAIAVSLQPLQFRMVQILEGYWSTKWLAGIYRAGLRRQQKRFDDCHEVMTQDLEAMTGDAEHVLMRKQQKDLAAEKIRNRFPKDRNRILPTSLGNVLRSAEDRAGERYGIEMVIIWSRLFPVLPPDHAEALEDEVLQLDLSARLAVTWLVTWVIGVIFLLTDPVAAVRNWGWIVFVMALLAAAILSYRSAVESALAYGEDIEVTFDLYRHRLIEASRMTPARRLSEETPKFELLADLYSAYQANHGINYAFHAESTTRPKRANPSALRSSGNAEK